MPRILHTTKGLIDETGLARTLGFEERRDEFVVWIEYRIGEEIVRRDAHVILKEPSVVADALAASMA